MKKLVLLPFLLILSTMLFVLPPDNYSRQQASDLPVLTLTVTPTPEPGISDFNLDCRAADYSRPLFSPSGNWAALRCIKNETPGLIVIHKNGTSHFIEFQPYTPDPDRKVDPEIGGGLLPARWTLDEKFLYFTSDLVLDGGGTCYYGSNSVGLYRLDVDSGDISAIFPVIPKMSRMIIFEFSPGIRYLAYIKNLPPDSPVILDMQTGEEITIPIKAKGVGDLHWSQDGKTLAFVACSKDPENEDLSIDRVFKFSLTENKAIQVYEGFHENILLEGFDDNNHLIVNTNFPYESGRMFFDLATNKMVVETPEK